MSLTKAFLEKLNDPNLSKDYTIDDFYEEMGIPKKNRSDFATAAIFKQLLELQKEPYPSLLLTSSYLKQCQKWLDKLKTLSKPGTPQYKVLRLAMSKAQRTQKLLKESIDLYLNLKETSSD